MTPAVVRPRRFQECQKKLPVKRGGEMKSEQRATGLRSSAVLRVLKLQFENTQTSQNKKLKKKGDNLSVTPGALEGSQTANIFCTNQGAFTFSA